jgi:ABC-2 type transport system ATP-binding protein
MSATDNLKITKSISGRGSDEDIDNVLKKVKLFERRKSRFSTYSLGMKQRLAIAGALLGNPSVLVLDEPTNGLDPVGIAEIRELIVALKDAGHTIIMASHLLDEVEKVCTHVVILKTGNVVATGAVEEVMKDEDMVELGATDTEALALALKEIGKNIQINRQTNTVQMNLANGTARLEEINRYCFEKGITLNHLILKKKRLEARFFELTNN